jgi:hypothetical protein
VSCYNENVVMIVLKKQMRRTPELSDLLVEETRRSDAGSRELQDCQNLLADRLTQVEVVEQAYHVN